MKKNEDEKEKKLMKKYITASRVSKTARISYDEVTHIISLIILKFPQSKKEFTPIGGTVYISEKGLDLFIDCYCKLKRVYHLMDLSLELEYDK